VNSGQSSYSFIIHTTHNPNLKAKGSDFEEKFVLLLEKEYKKATVYWN